MHEIQAPVKPLVPSSLVPDEEEGINLGIFPFLVIAVTQ